MRKLANSRREPQPPAMRCFVCLLLVLVLPNLALAQDSGDCDAPTAPAPELVEDLAKWIEVNTSYDVRRILLDPPRVVFCNTEEIIQYEGQELRVEPGIRAAFDATDRVIFLVRPWDTTNTYDISVLLHEMIHDVQLTNRRWDCKGAPEWEAYNLQAAWLREHGIEPEFDWLQIYMTSRCPRDVHPE